MTQKVTSWKQLDDDVDQMLTWNLCEPHSSCMLRSLDVDTACSSSWSRPEEKRSFQCAFLSAVLHSI